MPRILIVFLLIPILFAACSTNNVTVDDSPKKYFDDAGVTGCFGLYDNGQGHFTIYNLGRFRDSAYTPGPTFDILQALVGLQTGALANDTTRVGGASLQRVFTGEFEEAGSRGLAAVVGRDSLKKWVDSLRYGNRDISEFFDSGATAGKLRITADEQMGITKKLYFDQLPFFQRTQLLVREMFMHERNSNYSLVYKTGRAIGADGKVVGWIMGWVEENKHPYFFVCNMQPANGQIDVSAVGLQLVKKILRPMGFFEGKK